MKEIATTYLIKLDNKDFPLHKEEDNDVKLLDPIHIIDIHFYFYGITNFLIT
jgi:hypothetical protein